MDLGASLGHGTSNTGELYALGMLFTHLTHLKNNSLPSLATAFVFCDSQLAIRAATAKKFATNITLCLAVSRAYSALVAVCKVELHWIRGHSRVGGNERVDRISKLYASIDNNPARVEFDGVFRPRISHTPWPFGFCLTGLPDRCFLMRLPTPHLSKTVRGISATSEVSVSSSSRSGLDLAEDLSECDFKHGDHLPPQREFTDGMAVDLSPTSSVFLAVTSLK